MKHLPIDFAPGGLRQSLRRSGWLTWMTLCLAGVLLATAAALYIQVGEESARHNIQRESALRRTRLAEREAQRAVTPTIPVEQVNAVNELIKQLNLPWSDLYDAVADGTPAGIALLSMEPDAQKRIVRITAEARDSDSMVGYVERLKKQEIFKGATITRHEISQSDPNRPIRFELEAAWSL